MNPSPDTDKPIIEASPKGSDQPDLTGRALRLRIRQQEILAELGVLALQGASFAELLNQTARLTAEGLEVEFCKVMEYLPGQNELLVRAGVGWDASVIGSARVGADLGLAGRVCFADRQAGDLQPLRERGALQNPELLVKFGIRRAMNVILQGDGAPFGVLEVDARTEGDFSEHDIAFLQGAANVLGMAIERERQERRLKAAVERQEVLLKEIHHRVKNSLQLVSSMLYLQAADGDDPDLRRQLQEASARVLTIARAHERLYKDDDITVLDFGSYLRDVCRDLDFSASQCSVEIAAADGIRLATDKAIPLALIATELVTNAAKYAYPPPAKGTVRVALTRHGDSHIVLSVSDDGEGLPSQFNHQVLQGTRHARRTRLCQSARCETRRCRADRGAEFMLLVPLNPLE